ncbi:MAG: 4-hydroxy-tetrahydrodipicolinate reductase [Fimbriimonadaceae bacterium]|nr:4-hydroxy-tetrahydrodipicolinate reductase [Fimbriimonadaceae bacterium]QYK56615.1 MAG: 4-hydroxy-tetrahydrodipicolinate reductase [Fimbriimonadaceae bacterium]
MSDTPIRVCLVGAAGKMGRHVLRALGTDRRFQVVSAIDRQSIGQSCREIAGPESPDLVIGDAVGAALEATPTDVLVDFTHPSAAAAHAQSALKRRVPPVIGTSGLSNEDVACVRDACNEFQTPAMIVPNFAIGALLMMRFAEMAAAWMPFVEVIEYHNPAKADAPSGTAIHTAELIKAARQKAVGHGSSVEKFPGARGADVKGVRVHSVRLPGLVAHQEILFGGDGEQLTLRHDSLDRVSFMEGVKLACLEVRSFTGLVTGLDKVMFR